MDEKTRADWIKIFGREMVDDIIAKGENLTAYLEAMGVAYKGTQPNLGQLAQDTGSLGFGGVRPHIVCSS